MIMGEGEGDAEFKGEFQRQRTHINKETGEAEEFDPADNEKKPETDFFEIPIEEEEGEEKGFMAVKPWIGAIKEPDNHPPVNTSKPDTTYQIDYVFGYRCEDSRQNVFYNPDGNIVYMTACLGIILDKNSNTQTFFGGGEVENTSK